MVIEADRRSKLALKTMNSEQARTQWRDLLDLASRGEKVVIERHGKPTAIVMSYEVYQTMEATLQGAESDETARTHGEQMAAILERIAARSERVMDEDPVQWQRELRKERPLPGRSEDAPR
jgi:prevent-host-death family protein